MRLCLNHVKPLIEAAVARNSGPVSLDFPSSNWVLGSLRSKPFQSSYCAKVRAGVEKN